MKKGLIIGMVLSLFGCQEPAKTGERIDNTDSNAPKEIVSKDIVKFYLDAFPSDASHSNHPKHISVDLVLEGKEDDEDVIYVSKDIMDELQEVIDTYNIVQHNGMDVHVGGLPEVGSVSMYVTYESGEQIKIKTNTHCPIDDAFDDLFDITSKVNPSQVTYETHGYCMHCGKKVIISKKHCDECGEVIEKLDQDYVGTLIVINSGSDMLGNYTNYEVESKRLQFTPSENDQFFEYFGDLQQNPEDAYIDDDYLLLFEIVELNEDTFTIAANFHTKWEEKTFNYGEDFTLASTLMVLDGPNDSYTICIDKYA